MKSSQTTVAGGTLVAAGMMTMNVTVYAFNVLAARLLVPREFGALTALFGIILVGTVASARTAGRHRPAAGRRAGLAGEIIAATIRVTALAASAVGLAVAATTVVMTPALKLDSHWPVILCGATLVPMTVMGAQSGIAQGTSRWGFLTAIYVGNGLGRLVGGTVALLISPTPTSAMIGIAIGAWTPVLAGAPMLLGHFSGPDGTRSAASMLREALLSTSRCSPSSCSATWTPSSPATGSTCTRAACTHPGLILAKAAFFLPQFVSVVLFPDLARATSHHARCARCPSSALLGALTVAGTAVLPQLALILVGGDEYAAIRDRLWLFALAGSLLAIVYLLVFDALARHAHGDPGDDLGCRGGRARVRLRAGRGHHRARA